MASRDRADCGKQHSPVIEPESSGASLSSCVTSGFRKDFSGLAALIDGEFGWECCSGGEHQLVVGLCDVSHV